MSWWTWVIVGYFGSVLVLLAAFGTLCGIIALTSRALGRRLVEDAERFLADIAPSVESSAKTQ